MSNHPGPMGGEYSREEVQGILDRTAQRIAESARRCSYWADGEHCFVTHGTALAEERRWPPGAGVVKVCDCGARVEPREVCP